MTAALPGLAHLHSVGRWTQLFGVVLTGAALLLAGPRGQLGCVAGVVLMVGNAWSLGFFGRRLGPLIGTGNHGPLMALVILFNVKLLILSILIYLCMSRLPIDPLAFLLGLSTLPAAVLARALQVGWSGVQKTPPEQ